MKKRKERKRKDVKAQGEAYKRSNRAKKM